MSGAVLRCHIENLRQRWGQAVYVREHNADMRTYVWRCGTTAAFQFGEVLRCVSEKGRSSL